MKRVLKAMTVAALSAAMSISVLPVVSRADGELEEITEQAVALMSADELPAGEVLQSVDTTALTAFTPASEVAAGTYYFDTDKTFSKAIKYKASAVSIYGQGYSFLYNISGGNLLGSDTNSNTVFYDMVMDGGSTVNTAAPFQIGSKKAVWTFNNCLIRNYNTGENAVIEFGGSNETTLNLSDFKLESITAAHSINMNTSASKSKLNLGKNITIPDLYISQSNKAAVTLQSDFTGEVGFSAAASLINESENDLQNPVAEIETGADTSGLSSADADCILKIDNGKLYIVKNASVEPEQTEEPAQSAEPEQTTEPSQTQNPSEPADPTEGTYLPAKKITQKPDTAAMTVFAPTAADVAAGNYYMNSDVEYTKGELKYKKDSVNIYGFGYTLFHNRASGGLLACDGGVVAAFYDMVIDGKNTVNTAATFNTGSKAATWKFDNCVIQNYNAGGNPLMELGKSAATTVTLSDFEIADSNIASHSIHVYPTASGKLNLGRNVTIPDIYVDEGSISDITFGSDFTGSVGISTVKAFKNNPDNLKTPIAAVADGADVTQVKALDENCTLTVSGGKLYVVTDEDLSEPETDADLYAVYTLDGTADGEISRVKLLSSYSGENISVPNTAFSARKFTDSNGLYDIYKCVSADKTSLTLAEGENLVYITVAHADGKYYYWEDFESCDLGSVPSDNKWNHGGAGTKSDFINCTTDTANTTTAARWVSNNAGGSRAKTFSIFNGIPDVPEGEKLVFSADLRIGVTNQETTKLSFGNSADQMFLMSLKTSMETALNNGDTVVLPSVTGSNTEAGGSRTLSKWFNLNITIDPSVSYNNTTVTLTPLNAGDTFKVTSDVKPDGGFEYRGGAVICYDSGTLIIADYNENNVLQNLETKKVSEGDTVDVEAKIGRRLMLWGNLEGMKPLDSSIDLPAEEKPIERKTDTVTEYSYKTTSSVNAVTQMGVELCKGYFGAVIADNIMLYNTQSQYLTPAQNELEQAVAIYGDIDTAKYTDTNMAAYEAAAANAKSVMADSESSNAEVKDAKEELVKAANSLELKTVKNGERTVADEDADWIFIKEYEYQSDAAEIAVTAPEKLSLSGWTGIDVPHTWNAYDGSDGIQGYDRCRSWYRKSIYIKPEYEGKRIYLEFEGAALKASLYVNGKAVPFTTGDPYSIGEDVTYIHRGGYETFRYDITDYVTYDGANTVAVCVDNTATIETIPLGGDYSKEGGMYRDVSLVVTEPVHIDMTDHGSKGLYLLPKKVTDVTDNTNKDFTLTASAKIVNDSDSAQNIKIEAELREPDHFDVPDNDYIKEHLRFDPKDMYTEGGRTVETFTVKQTELAAGESYDYSDTINVTDPKLWDGMESPYSYEVVLNVYRDDVLCDTITDNVGFRYYYAPNPTSLGSGGGFYLNGRKYDLRGVGKHQDRGRKEDALGVAVTDKERLEDAATMYEMGINTVRLVHYPHSVREIEIYDKLGIVVWSELAMTSVICNADAKGYPSFEATSLEQLESLIKQQYNNPSVFFWAFSNEITHEFDDSLKLISSQEKVFSSAPALFDKMQAKAKELDSERFTTYAANTIRHTPDLNTDLLSMNTYPYWYNTRSSDNPKSNLNNYFNLEWADSEKTTKKPISFGEIGGAGIAGDTQEYNEDGTVTFLGTKFGSATYQTYMHEKILQGIETGTPAVWSVYLWQMFDSANDTTDAVFPGMNIKGVVSHDHKTRKDAYYFYKANWNSFEPFVYVVNASVIERSDTETIIRAYSNMDKCQLYVNGEKYGAPITDTNTADKVVDGYHVFMWYGVPLSGGGNTIEVRGIRDGKEECTSVDTNGAIVFTSSFDSTSLKLTDTTKLNLNGDNIELLCMAKDAPLVSEIANITGVLSGSTVSVIMPDGTAVTDGRLCEGMGIRVTGSGGEYKDYTVIAEDIAKNAAVTASDGSDTTVLNDGSTAAVWNGNAGSSLVIDLGDEYKLNGLDVYFDTASPYSVQVSTNGTSYTDASSAATASDKTTSDKFDLTGRYVKITFTSAVSISEINIYGWRFTVSGGHSIDESAKTITVNQSGGEVDTTQLENDIKIDGEATYGFDLQEATRVLSDGDKLVVTEKFGTAKEYTLKLN